MPDENASKLAWRVTQRLMDTEGTADSWNLILEEAGEGHARVRMTVRADMLNGHRTAHGGMIFALADSAFAYACNSRNEMTVAQQASILFLSPAAEGDVLIAEAREDARAGRSGSYSVAVRTDDGRPIAQFQGLSRTTGGSVLFKQE
jgi:acyl-CoA thioesterase